MFRCPVGGRSLAVPAAATCAVRKSHSAIAFLWHMRRKPRQVHRRSGGCYVGPMPCPAQSEPRMLRPRPGPKGCGTGRMPVIASVIGVVADGAGPCTLALAQARCRFVPWFAVTAAASRQLLQPACPRNRHSCAVRRRHSETAAPEDRRRLSKR